MQIVAAHCVWGAYGFWLPNDPRGSGSRYVGSHAIWVAGGNASFVQTDRSSAGDEHDITLRAAGKGALRKPPMVFDGRQISAIADGFAAAIAIGNYSLYACAIMPDHVHVVLGHQWRVASKIVAHLKSFATKELNRQGLCPYQGLAGRDGRRVWADRFRQMHLAAAEVPRCVQYVSDNPLNAGLAAQKYSFVRPWNG